MDKQDITYEQFLELISERSPKDSDSDNPINQAVEMLQGKWKIRILFELSKADFFRYGKLRKAIPKITNTMLTTTLRELEDCGLVSRAQFNEIPPHVEYSLTPKGRELLPVFYEIFKWAERNFYLEN